VSRGAVVVIAVATGAVRLFWMDDTEVISAVLAGDIDRYAELVTRYQAAAWRLAYGVVGNMEDAKELSQNAFVKAYQRLRQFRGHARFSTWLYRIVVNECKGFLRHKARRVSVVSMSADPEADDPIRFDVPDPSGNPRDAVADGEFARALGVAIDALALKQRTAFVLHHLQGMSLAETAEVMACRVGTVKAHVFRACEQLRVRLSPHVPEEGWL